MNLLRRVVNVIFSGLKNVANPSESIHMARAYRPVTPKMMPRWRNLGKAITPYHFMQPVPVPVQQSPSRQR